MNAANRARLDTWRARYLTATGRLCDVFAHITQRQRGIAWWRREDSRTRIDARGELFQYKPLARDDEGYLPVRTPWEVHAVWMLEAGIVREVV